MAIQPAFNEYNALIYLCQYFSKTKDQCLQAVKKLWHHENN